MRVDLKKLLTEYCNAHLEHIQEATVSECTLSILQLRDRLYLLGNILYEDLDNQVYIAFIRSGIANMNSAVIAMQLQGTNLFLVGYAKEGLIKQNICEKAMRKLIDTAHGVNVSNTSHTSRIIPILLTVITITVFILIRSCVVNHFDFDAMGNALIKPGNETEVTTDPAFAAEIELTVEATKAYNQAVEQFNLRVVEYNKSVVMTSIDNITDLPASLEMLTTESESYEDIAQVVQGANNKEIIKKDTDTIRLMTNQVEQLIMVIHQITAPSGEWVAERLSAVSSITGTQAVTEELDPDDLLGKEGSFSDCIYFTITSIDSDTVPGNNIVEKGTDAGGAVEVYATLEEAEARCEYLSGFDGTILYSGSYAIVGTMVVRTSYKLTNEQQLALTRNITRALTALSADN